MRTGKAAMLMSLVASFAPLATPNVIQVKATGSIRGTSLKTAFPDGQSVALTFTFESSGLPQITGVYRTGYSDNTQAFYVDKVLSISVVSGSYNSSYNAAPFGQLAKSTQDIGLEFRSDGASYKFTNPKPRGVQMATVVDGGVTQTFVSGVFHLESISRVWSDYSPVVHAKCSATESEGKIVVD